MIKQQDILIQTKHLSSIIYSKETSQALAVTSHTK